MAAHHGTKYTKEETDRYVDVNGIKIHYNEAGQGPALFCFHGGGPGSNAWDNSKHNLDELAEHFRCIVMDMPGYGYSDKNAKLNGTPLDLFCANIILGVMDKLGIERAHLYGSSQFCPACIRFGIEYPDRVGKLIIQASGVARGANYFTASPPDGIKALGAYAENPTRENMEKMMHLFIPKDELCTEEMIEARFQAAQIPGHLAGRREMAASKNSDLLPLISRLKAPVLVVWGHQDRMVPWEGALSALALIPDVRIHIWGGGTGHFVEYEKAEEFNRLVTGFLTL
jgi:pimeloyl-ACP methyl ester carboxylesterase